SVRTPPPTHLQLRPAWRKHYKTVACLVSIESSRSPLLTQPTHTPNGSRLTTSRTLSMLMGWVVAMAFAAQNVWKEERNGGAGAGNRVFWCFWSNIFCLSALFS